jgi:hypothetical protein
MVAFNTRMGIGYEGATNRNQHSLVVGEILSPTAPPTSYGVMLSLDAATSTVRAATTGDTASTFWGFYVRPWPTQGGGFNNPVNDGLGTSTPPGPTTTNQPGNIANVMKRGYMTVRLNAASPNVVKGQQVGIFIGTPSAGNPAGGVTGAAPGATVIAVPGAFFNGPSDAVGGITEIGYNL